MKESSQKKMSQEKLAEIAFTSREKISHFLNGKPVEKNLFIEICKAMELEPKELALELLPTPISY
jgi:DNA-binding Xre family transcriptional regulator